MQTTTTHERSQHQATEEIIERGQVRGRQRQERAAFVVSAFSDRAGWSMWAIRSKTWGMP